MSIPSWGPYTASDLVMHIKLYHFTSSSWASIGDIARDNQHSFPWDASTAKHWNAVLDASALEFKSLFSKNGLQHFALLKSITKEIYLLTNRPLKTHFEKTPNEITCPKSKILLYVRPCPNGYKPWSEASR